MTRELSPTKYGGRQQILGIGDLVVDAWGRQKVINDLSLLHGLFTYDVPPLIWKEYANGTEQLGTGIQATSVDGALNLESTTGNNAALYSLRHPRYQPNRGHLYSGALWFPTPNEAGTIREWGLQYGDRCGIFFRLTDDGLYAVRLRKSVEKVVAQIPLPAGFDITKGHLYDIQYQWRGVGNYFFYVDQELAYTDENIGLLGEGELPTICNPALPVFFKVTGDAKLRCGCVDVTSEGGTSSNLKYRSVTTGVDVASIHTSKTYADGVAVAALRVPNLFQSLPNTRDAILNRVTTFCKDEATTAVFAFRDPSILGGIATNTDPALGWAPTAIDSSYEYMIGGDGSTLATTFEANHTALNSTLLVAVRQEMDMPNQLFNPNPSAAPFYITAGDYIVVTVYPDGGGKNTGCTIEWAEEV